MTKALTGKRLRAALACATVLSLAACSEEPPFDVASQIGQNPNLPPLQQYLFPPMHLARVVGWKEGEKPTVADGLKIEALATGLGDDEPLFTLVGRDVPRELRDACQRLGLPPTGRHGLRYDFAARLRAA